jgi:hypothetical protein
MAGFFPYPSALQKELHMKSLALALALALAPLSAFAQSSSAPDQECAASLAQSLSNHTKATGKQIADAIQMYCKPPTAPSGGK